MDTNNYPSKVNDYMTQMVLSLILHLKNILTVTNLLHMKTVLKLFSTAQPPEGFVMDFSVFTL